MQQDSNIWNSFESLSDEELFLSETDGEDTSPNERVPKFVSKDTIIVEP